MNLTTSGHYCIPIDRAEKIPVQKVFSVDLEEMASKDSYKTLFKLHRQFAHPPMKKLKSLLQAADQWKMTTVTCLNTYVTRVNCANCMRKHPVSSSSWQVLNVMESVGPD